MKPVKTALIGYGHLGRFHAQKIAQLEEAQFIAIVEPFAASQVKAKEAHPEVMIVSSIEELPSDVEAAIVATPTSFHFELCQKLIKRNIHVFCEKPITDKLADALKLEAQMQSSSLVFQAGHSERCHEAWEFKEKFAPYLTSESYLRLDRYAPFKGRATDVDVVNDLMIHDLDLLCFLLGSAPYKIEAQGFKQRTRHYDHAIAHLTWKNGTKATITVGRGHVHEVRSLEAVNSAGLFRVDLMNNTIAIAPAKAEGIDQQNYQKRDHLLLEQKAFYRAIRDLGPVMVNLNDGIVAVKLIDAVLQSLDSNQVVELK